MRMRNLKKCSERINNKPILGNPILEMIEK